MASALPFTNGMNLVILMFDLVSDARIGSTIDDLISVCCFGVAVTTTKFASGFAETTGAITPVVFGSTFLYISLIFVASCAAFAWSGTLYVTVVGFTDSSAS